MRKKGKKVLAEVLDTYIAVLSATAKFIASVGKAEKETKITMLKIPEMLTSKKIDEMLMKLNTKTKDKFISIMVRTIRLSEAVKTFENLSPDKKIKLAGEIETLANDMTRLRRGIL